MLKIGKAVKVSTVVAALSEGLIEIGYVPYDNVWLVIANEPRYLNGLKVNSRCESTGKRLGAGGIFAQYSVSGTEVILLDILRKMSSGELDIIECKE